MQKAVVLAYAANLRRYVINLESHAVGTLALHARIPVIELIHLAERGQIAYEHLRQAWAVVFGLANDERACFAMDLLGLRRPYNREVTVVGAPVEDSLGPNDATGRHYDYARPIDREVDIRACELAMQ